LGGVGWLDGEVGEIIAIQKFYDINQCTKLTQNNYRRVEQKLYHMQLDIKRFQRVL
jgi:hypothetical protein